MWQLHLEYGIEPTHSSWIHALPGTQGVRVSSKRCVPAARAGCGAATNSRHAFSDIFDAFVPYSCNNPDSSTAAALAEGTAQRTAGEPQAAETSFQCAYKRVGTGLSSLAPNTCTTFVTVIRCHNFDQPHLDNYHVGAHESRRNRSGAHKSGARIGSETVSCAQSALVLPGHTRGARR